MATKRKPESEKLSPGRKRKPVEEHRVIMIPVRLTIQESADLDSVTDNRTAFCVVVINRAVAAAKKKQASPKK